ncbi:hypothetical protein JCM10207_004764 [Rhodosporidiobolus poonsookiae]
MLAPALSYAAEIDRSSGPQARRRSSEPLLWRRDEKDVVPRKSRRAPTALLPTNVSTVHDRAYYCPSPSSGRPAGAFDDLSSFSPFIPLDSPNPAFNLSLSYSHSRCNTFRLRIARQDRSACRALLPDLHEDKGTTDFVQHSLGPDTFQLQTDGAERLVVDDPTRFDPESCSYEFDVALANAGAVWLQVTHFYEDYNTYISAPSRTLPRLITPLLPAPLHLSICDDCTPYVPPVLTTQPSTFPASPPLPSLPACTGPEPIRGVYVPSALPSLLYPPYQLPMTPKRPSAGFHTFVPTGCSFQHDGLRFRDHQSCFRRPHRALFLGDSHARGMFDVLAHRLKGNDEMALSSFKVTNKISDIQNLHLEFMWDAYLVSNIFCAYMHAFDTVVLSTGSHQACYNCPPTSEYLAHMQRIFREWPLKLTQCREQARTGALLRAEDDGALAARAREKPPTRFIFATSPAWYPKKAEQYDCRTAQRLGRWNDLVTAAALREGWAVVDAGAVTRPMQQDTRAMDGVHYIRTDAIDPIVDEVVEKMGICGNSSER